MNKLDFSYDEENDVMTIEGIRYVGNFFRFLGVNGLAVGNNFRIVKRGDGNLEVLKIE